MRYKAVIHPERCTGCRSCVLACSFHHARLFSPSISSIWVYRDLEKGRMTITLYDRKSGTHLPCDGCEGEQEPLCVKYCDTKAITFVREEKNERNI